MSSRKRRVQSLSRDPRFLLRAALAVLGVAAVLGFALSRAGFSFQLWALHPAGDGGGWVDSEPGHAFAEALRERDLAGVFGMVVRAWAGSFWWPAAAASVVTGAVWFTLVASVLGLPARQWLWGVPALLLGAASTLLAVFLLVLQEGYVGFAETGDVFRDAVYFTAGVGLREEAAKLLFFLPLLPFLRRAGSPALALACASWVGLGFAVEENMNYFMRSAGQGMWARFVTANFFHLAATGLAGYALYRCSTAPAKYWEMALGTFLAAVGLHGAFNYVQSNPAIAPGWSFVSIVVIGLLAYWYFAEADRARASVRRPTVSPLAVLVLGSAVVLGVSLVFMFLSIPAGSVFSQFVYASAGVAPVAFIFVNRFRDV